MNEKNEQIIMRAQLLPEIRKEDIGDLFKVSKSLIPELGVISQSSGKGLYKCVFPKGVTGTLATKDGANLGTIMGEDGIVGQARWIEQKVDPTMIFVTAALHNVEEKLDTIIETTKEMFQFEQIKEESKLYGNALFLTQALKDYKNSFNNKLWLNSITTEIAGCLRESLAYIKQYKELASNAAEDDGLLDVLLHTNDKAEKRTDDVIKFLKNYQGAIFTFSFSEYVHTLVTENFDENHLLNVGNEINKLAYEYREIFTKISNKIEDYAKRSLNLIALDVAGSAVKGLADAAKKTPIIKNTNFSDVLSLGGDSLKGISKDGINNLVKELSKYSKVYVEQFEENVKKLGNLYHEKIELYCDEDYIYFK